MSTNIQVLTLLDLGLVDQEEVTAYYDALSNLERTTREAKQAAVAGASKPPLSLDREKSEATRALQGVPLEFVPFPAVCAVLGAAGVHSLELPGHLSTVASTIGAIAGGAVGLLIVARDDVLGGAVRTVGSIAVESAGTAGMLVGRKISDTAESTLSMVVAEAVQVVIKAPSKAAGGLASSMSDSASSAIESIESLPRELANKSVAGVKDALQGTSQAAIGISGGLARQAAGAAGGALLNTSKAAIIAVKGSSKDAAKQLRKEAITGHGEPHVSFVKGETHAKVSLIYGCIGCCFGSMLSFICAPPMLVWHSGCRGKILYGLQAAVVGWAEPVLIASLGPNCNSSISHVYEVNFQNVAHPLPLSSI